MRVFLKHYISFTLIFNLISFETEALSYSNVIKIDLALESGFAKLSDGRVSFTIKLKNQAGILTNNIKVKNILPPNFQTQNITVSKGTYTRVSNTIIWDIDSIEANVSEHTINITGSLPTSMDFYHNQAEITQVAEEDLDSTPNNQNPCEDDITFVTLGGNLSNCYSSNSSILISAPQGFITYAWYKNGQIIKETSTSQLSIQSDGSYTFKTTFSNPEKSCTYLSKDSLKITTINCTSFCTDTTFKVCTGAAISQAISAPSGYKDIQWYKNDTLLIGQQSQTYIIKSPGSYTYLARRTDQDSTQQKTKGCTFKLIIIPPTMFELHISNASCQASTKGKIQVQNPTGEAPFTFSLNNSAFQSDSLFKDLNSGTYNVIVKDKSGCQTSLLNQKISLDSVLLSPQITADKQLICSFDKATLLASVCQDSANIVWSNSITNLSLIQVGEGTYTARCKNTCGISPPSNLLKISEDAVAPTPFIDVSKSVDCEGEKAVLTANFCTGNLVWSTGESSKTITVDRSGTYTAICQAPCGNSQTSITVSILATPIPIAPIIRADSYFVVSGQKVTLTATECNTGKLVWSTNEKSNMIQVGIGKYYAFCETACGKSSHSNTVEIKTEQPPFSPLISASKLQICEGEQITLVANGCIGDTVVWSTGAEGKSIITKPSKSTSYFASCKKGNKLDVSNLVTITVINPTKPILTATKTNSCAGESIKIIADNCSQELVWSDGQKGQSITIAPTSSSKYYAQCKVNSCESATSDTLLINVFSNNPPIISALEDKVCLGDTIQLLANGCTGKVQWTNGSIGTTLKVKTTNSGIQYYAAKCVSDAILCQSQSSDTLKITVLDLVPKPVIPQSLRNTCPDQFVNLNNALSSDAQVLNSTFIFKNDSLLNAETISDPTKITASGVFYVFRKSADACLSNPSPIVVGTANCFTNNSKDTVDIEILKSANVSVADINSNIFYKIVIKNTKKTIATNAQVVDFLPQNIEVIALSSNAKFKNGLIFINIPSLKMEDSVVVLYQVKTTVAGTFTNTAVLINLDQTDANPANNESSVIINDQNNQNLLGLSKELVYLHRLEDKLYNLSFNFKITHKGQKHLTHLQLSDDLSKTFGPSVAIKDIAIDTKNNPQIVINPNYSGFPPNTHLFIDSLSYLNPIDTVSIKLDFKLALQDTLKNIFYNSARVEISKNPSLYDISTDGQNPDPNNNGIATDNNTTTLINLSQPKPNPIAVSLNVVDTALIAQNTFEVRYMVLVKNQTNYTLNEVSIIDSLSKLMPEGIPFFVSQKPLISSKSFLIPNPNFNGVTDNFLTQTSSSVAANTIDTLIFGITFNFNAFLGPYNNQVYVTAKGALVDTYYDISNSGPLTFSWLHDTTTFYINPSTFPTEALLDIPGGFSPNGDGLNDELNIRLLKNIAIHKLELYNRYGAKVYEITNIPQNTEMISWNGKNKGINSLVPEGTYYYAIYINNSHKPIIGFITIKN
jgi:gliding motility-associated-like protein/uncharacterized repeat protein (TIGR01451 family)